MKYIIQALFQVLLTNGFILNFVWFISLIMYNILDYSCNYQRQIKFRFCSFARTEMKYSAVICLSWFISRYENHSGVWLINQTPESNNVYSTWSVSLRFDIGTLEFNTYISLLVCKLNYTENDETEIPFTKGQAFAFYAF